MHFVFFLREPLFWSGMKAVDLSPPCDLQAAPYLRVCCPFVVVPTYFEKPGGTPMPASRKKIARTTEGPIEQPALEMEKTVAVYVV